VRARRPWGSRLAAMTSVVAVAAIAACGSENEERSPRQDRQDVRAAFAELRAALADRDPNRACAEVSEATGRQAGSTGHLRPTACSRDMRKLFASVDGPGSGGRAVRPRVDEIALDGERAVVVADFGHDATGAFPFLREDGEWRLDSLYGHTATAVYPMGTPVPGIGVLSKREAYGPRLGGAPAAVRNEGRRCTALTVGELEARGGCRATTDTGPVRFRLRTLVADGRFADCYLKFTVRLSGAGELAIDDIQVSYTKVDTACGDIRECQLEAKQPPGEIPARGVPWQGRLRATASGLRAEVGACFETCAGRFEGGLRLALRRDERGWQLVARDAGVGRSGFQLSGRWRLRPDGLEISPAERRTGASRVYTPRYSRQTSLSGNSSKNRV
jgi:hypothetical protein